MDYLLNAYKRLEQNKSQNKVRPSSNSQSGSRDLRYGKIHMLDMKQGKQARQDFLAQAQKIVLAYVGLLIAFPEMFPQPQLYVPHLYLPPS